MEEILDLPHFLSIPWCSSLLKASDFVITHTPSRQSKADEEDSLVAETLNTTNTISKCLTFYKRPRDGDSFISEVYTLMTLGSGMNGGPRALHGGIITTIMDDVMGILLTFNKDPNRIPLTHSTVTGSLEVKFLQRVPTPGTVLVVAKCREVEGRKYFMNAEVRDQNGIVLAKAGSVWIRQKERVEKL